MRIVPLAFAVVCGVFFASTATADDDTADAHLQSGLALRREHKNEEALAEFRRAFAITPTARARAQIGFAEQALAQWTRAERDLRAALEAKSDPWIAKNIEAIETALGTIDERLGWLTMACDPAHDHVVLDGAPTDTGCNERIRVAAGSHTIHLTSDRGVPLDQSVDVAAHQEIRIVLLPPPAIAFSPPVSSTDGATNAFSSPSPSNSPSSPRTDSSSTQRSLGYAAGVVGIVGVSTGFVLGGAALHERATVQDHCHDKRCDAEGLSAGSFGSSLATWSTIAFAAGGISLAAAVTLVLTSPSPRALPSGVALRITIP